LKRLFILEHRVEHSLCRFRDLKVVGPHRNSVLKRVPKCRVPTRIIVLVLVEEQDLIADDACILAHLFGLPVLTCEGSLCTLLLRHVELKWREGLTIVFEHF